MIISLKENTLKSKPNLLKYLLTMKIPFKIKEC